MRIILASLNAKYIHTSLALACLFSSCQRSNWEVVVREYTINQNPDEILADLYKLQADILCFSCYIWNIEMTLRLAEDYKKIAPTSFIILGGPEVSYNALEILSKQSEIDCIVQGEGEETLPQLLDMLQEQTSLHNISGLSFRQGNAILENPVRNPVQDLDQLLRPAYEVLYHLHNRTIYYESSRGCPFDCSYCLSSTVRGTRYHSLSRVKEDLAHLHHLGVREIKFVDRTFNSDEKRAIEIMKFLLSQPGTTRYHFEIRAEVISDSFIEYISTVPDGRFYFEIGIQSTCATALEAVNRKSSWEQSRNRISKLREESNVQLHLDLIAGLPGEDYDRFKISFNDVMLVKPHVLQLGFLKLLKGSPLTLESEQYGYIVKNHPPYEILGNQYMGYNQITQLHKVEDMVQRYYNSGAFSNTIEFAAQQIYFSDYFLFFENLSHYWSNKGLFGRAHKREAEYSYLADFFAVFHPEQKRRGHEFLKLDYLLHQGPHRMPGEIERHNPDGLNEKLYSLLKNNKFVEQYTPHLQGLNPGDRRRRVHLEYLNVDPCTGDDCQDLAVLFVYPPGSRKASHTVSLHDDIVQ